jgi:hypothetical protein
MDLNATHVCCAGPNYERVQNDLFSTVDSLHTKTFSVSKVKNMHFIYNSATLIIGLDVELGPYFF